MKTWIGVEVYQLIVQDVHVFEDFEKAKEWFKEYTGVDYAVDAKGELPDLFYQQLGEDYDQTKIFEVEVPEKKAATVEVCYIGKDHKFRCPECASLNINGTETLNKCPDCKAEFAVPEVTECDCKDKFDLTKPGKYFFQIGIHGPGKNAEDAWVQAVEGFIDEVGEMDPNEIVDFEEEEDT